VSSSANISSSEINNIPVYIDLINRSHLIFVDVHAAVVAADKFAIRHLVLQTARIAAARRVGKVNTYLELRVGRPLTEYRDKYVVEAKRLQSTLLKLETTSDPTLLVWLGLKHHDVYLVELQRIIDRFGTFSREAGAGVMIHHGCENGSSGSDLEQDEKTEKKGLRIVSSTCDTMRRAMVVLGGLDIPDGYFEPRFDKCYCSTCITDKKEVNEYGPPDAKLKCTRPLGFVRFGVKVGGKHGEGGPLDVFKDWYKCYSDATSSTKLLSILESGLLPPGTTRNPFKSLGLMDYPFL